MQRVDADLSCGRRTSSMGTQSSRRYVGATPLTHFQYDGFHSYANVQLVVDLGALVNGSEHLTMPRAVGSVLPSFTKTIIISSINRTEPTFSPFSSSPACTPARHSYP